MTQITNFLLILDAYDFFSLLVFFFLGEWLAREFICGIIEWS